MNRREKLTDTYRSVVSQIPGKYGVPWRPSNKQGNNLFRISQQIAASLFDADNRVILEDGSVLLELNDGSLVALCCLASNSAHATAIPINGAYLIGVSTKLFQATFSLLASLFSEAQLMANAFSPPTKRDDDSSPLPPGFERLIWEAEDEMTKGSTATARGSEALGALVDAVMEAEFQRLDQSRLERLSGERRSSFELSVAAAIRFLWLHEIGHVLGGHLDLLGSLGLQEEISETNLGLADAPSETSEHEPSFLFYGVEIEADTWALRAMAKSQKSSSDGSLIEAIGVIAIFLLFYGIPRLTGNTETSIQHPPVWYRARRASIELLGGPPRGMFRQILLQASELHPMFGEWLDPLSRDQWEDAAKGIDQEVRRFFGPSLGALANMRRKFSFQPKL